MGGGLIQLKFLGKEADFFIGNPQISFFRSVFKSYSNYSKELIDIFFESPLKFNTNTYANIPINADLIQNMYLYLNLKVNVTDSFDLTIKSGVTATTSPNINTISVDSYSDLSVGLKVYLNKPITSSSSADSAGMLAAFTPLYIKTVGNDITFQKSENDTSNTFVGSLTVPLDTTLFLYDNFSSDKKGVLNEDNSTGGINTYMYNYIYKVSNTDISDFKINEIGTTVERNLYNSSTKEINLMDVTNNKLYYSYVLNSTTFTGEIYVRFLKEDMTKFIKEISFEIDEYVIEKHNTDWLLIYNKLFNNNETLNKINDELKYISPKMFNKNVQIYIPLRFFFTKDTQSVLPIVALYRSDVNIRIKTNSQEDVFLSNKIISSIDINKGVLAGNYIYLDKNEKNYFLKNKHNLLIEQLQYQNNMIKNGIYNQVELNFSYLSKYMIWKLPYKYILDKGKIIFNNNDLFYEQSGEYFHLIQPFEHNLGNKETLTRMEENEDPNGTYYMYSFSLYPNKKQPSGLCNMSRIDDKFLELRTDYIKDVLNINKKINVDIYSVNYNFLHIEKGKCKLEF